MVIVTLLSCALFEAFCTLAYKTSCTVYCIVKVLVLIIKDSEFYPSESRVVTTKLATRMARLGRVNEFVPEKETISVYLERIDMFFLANVIREEKKVPASPTECDWSDHVRPLEELSDS